MIKKLNDKNFIAIADWMISDFDFNTRELLCYAIIYGFSQDGESVFSGSLSYLASWLNIRRDNVLRYLNSLVEKKVVIKEKKSSANKSWCEYRVVLDRGAARNSDHIIISPWMITECGLKDKELILYALIHGFSRVGSNSVFSGNNTYMAKWLKIDKQHVTRYTSSLIKKGLIERTEKENVITYKAIIPKKGKGNCDPNQFEYTLTNNNKEANQNEYMSNQFEDTPNQSEGICLTNLSTNNISLNNLNNNLNNILFNNNIDNTYISSPFVVEKELLDHAKDVIYNSNTFSRFLESKDVSTFINAAERVLKNIKNQSKKRREKICYFSEDQFLNLLDASLNIELDIFNTFENPDGYIVSKINEEIDKIPKNQEEVS